MFTVVDYFIYVYKHVRGAQAKTLGIHLPFSTQQSRRQQFLLTLIELNISRPQSTMNRFVSLCLIVVALVASSVQGFAPSSLGGVSGGECCVIYSENYVGRHVKNRFRSELNR